MVDGKLMVPIYEVYEKLGCSELYWENEKQRVTAWYYINLPYDDHYALWVQLTAGNKKMECAQPEAATSSFVELEAAPVMIDGCMFATTDAISKGLCHTVDWDATTKTLTINEKKF